MHHGSLPDRAHEPRARVDIGRTGQPAGTCNALGRDFHLSGRQRGVQLEPFGAREAEYVQLLEGDVVAQDGDEPSDDVAEAAGLGHEARDRRKDDRLVRHTHARWPTSIMPGSTQPPVPTLTSGLSWIDLEFLGRRHAIATGVVQDAGGVALIDPGPSTCLGVLERELQKTGIQFRDVTHILLTHIHLDHAGATGSLVHKYPHMRVLVHERGAPHMADPAKLVQSAARLYTDRMELLWGEVLPVPVTNLHVLTGGETLRAGGRDFDVAYTPGHASHHVSYFDASSGVAFVGDTAGVCVDNGYVLPPTPPPDIDLDLWAGSVARIEQWSPSTLFLTHFGPIVTVRPHLQALLDNLTTTSGLVRAWLEKPGSDDQRRVRFVDDLRRELRRQMTEEQAVAYETASPLDLQWLGLARYWRKRGVGD